MSTILNEIRTIPMLALRGLSVFPGMMLTFDVERSASIAALNQAVRTDQMIFLSTQTNGRKIAIWRVCSPRKTSLQILSTITRM